MTATPTAVAARASGAALLASGVAVALHRGGVPWLVVAPAIAGVLLLALWRSVPGAWAGFAVLALAAAVAWHGAVLSPAMRDLALPLIALELFGWASILAVALVRDPPRRISRRLLTSWVGSTGAVLLGLGLCASLPTRAAGSALLVAGLMYRLGSVPAYAWAPLLMRHPLPRITVIGIAATLFTVGVLLFALPRLQLGAAAVMIDALCGVTIPWAAWNVVRKWRRDRRCALSYLMVSVVSMVLVAVVKLLHA